MATISLRNVCKRFGKTSIIENLSLEIADQEFVVLVGPSGCGKSTLLRMIAGLEDLTSGQIFVNGKSIENVPARLRDIAMVFQNYALYPHMSVAENMGLSLLLRKLPSREISRKVGEVAEALGISHLLDRKPKELSGGQRQRVAMGRAIIRNPVAFLFDEPLSNLDAELRLKMRTEIKRLHGQMPTTSVYVTHDQTEAMTLADRIVVLKGGKIQQVGSPLELYHDPCNQFVAGFIGSPAMNFFDSSRKLDFFLRTPTSSVNALIGVRPEHLLMCETVPEWSGLHLQGSVAVVEPLGADMLVTFDCAGESLVVKCPTQANLVRGMPKTLASHAKNLHYFDKVTGLALSTGA